jgi:site-specific recombinase XerD
MMVAEEYLGKSRLLRRLKKGPHEHLIDRYTGRLIKDELACQGIWRCLSLVEGLLNWLSAIGLPLGELDERVLERYLKHRWRKHSFQPGDRSALKRLLSVMREANLIAPAPEPPISVEETIFQPFAEHLRQERGLTSGSIIRHLPTIRRFLREQCPAGAGDLAKLRQEDVIGYVQRHARDASAASGRAMCYALRSFLRYLYHSGLNPLELADCVPSIRRWALASLPSAPSGADVQHVLDGCDRTTALGRRDYAILMLLAKLGLRANEVATLTLDDLDWRAGTLRVHAKGRQQTWMPIPPAVGTAVVAYLREDRPVSACRRLFLRTLAPHVGFASGRAITAIARSALERAGISGYAHQGAHLFRHSLASELLRSGATLPQIAQVLGHAHLDTTRLYAKVDLHGLRTLSLPWPGGLQ